MFSYTSGRSEKNDVARVETATGDNGRFYYDGLLGLAEATRLRAACAHPMTPPTWIGNLEEVRGKFLVKKKKNSSTTWGAHYLSPLRVIFIPSSAGATWVFQFLDQITVNYLIN
jgi:hypothetical protein